MPRAGVTAAKVLGAAEEIANRDGYSAVTLGRIAEHFGIRTPSLYKHIKNLDEVREHLALRGYEGLRDAALSTRGVSGATRIRALAAAYRAFALANPGLYEASQPTHLSRGPAAQTAARELLEEVLAVLRELNIREGDLLNAARSLRSTMHGFVSLELAGGFGMPGELDESFAYLMENWLAGATRD